MKHYERNAKFLLRTSLLTNEVYCAILDYCRLSIFIILSLSLPLKVFLKAHFGRFKYKTIHTTLQGSYNLYKSYVYEQTSTIHSYYSSSLLHLRPFEILKKNLVSMKTSALDPQIMENSCISENNTSFSYMPK